MQLQYCYEQSICLSVCLSVKRVNCDKTKENCAQFYSIWKINHPSFPTKRMIGGERPILPKISSQTDPLSKMATSNWYLL